jgi:hypothetical protein
VRPTVAPSAAQVEEHLAELVQPAIYAQVAAYQAMGLRHRLLTLPVGSGRVARAAGVWPRPLNRVGWTRVMRPEQTRTPLASAAAGTGAR